MRTGQRDVHNTPLKRRLSITYEELETLKKSIKVSVLNELRAEMENVSNQDSIKDGVLSEIRTELMGLPDPAVLKASILKELRMELKASGKTDSAADRKLRELAGIQDGLIRELLDQKTLIKKLETQIENLTKQLKNAKEPAPVASSISLALPEDPLDLPSLSRKTKQRPEYPKESPAYKLGKFKEAPASLPGTKVQLKLREVEPAELDRQEAETKCEYIIAESGDKRWHRGNIKSEPKSEPSIRESARQAKSLPQSPRSPESSFSTRKLPTVKKDLVKPQLADDSKCEYIIAERPSKNHLIEESVDVRENEDAEVITCSRKTSQT